MRAFPATEVPAGALSRLRVGIFLERAGVGMERAGAVKLRDLTDVPQVVGSPLAEHLMERNVAKFGVRGVALAGILGNAPQQDDGGAAALDEIRESLAAGPARIVADDHRGAGVKLLQPRRIFGDDAARAVGVDHLNIREMAQHFSNGPAVDRGLPTQQLLRQIAKHRFEQNRRLFNERQGGLNGSSDARLGGSSYTLLHAAPPKRILHLTRKGRKKLNRRIMSNTYGGAAWHGKNRGNDGRPVFSDESRGDGEASRAGVESGHQR